MSRARLHGRVEAGASAGFTIVEVIIAVAVLAMISVNVAMISRSSSTAARTGSLLSVLNGELDLTVERMELALMGAHADEVTGSVNPFPLYSNRVDFTIDVGIDNDTIIFGDPERIEWTPMGEDGGRVSWIRNPGDEVERAVTWSSSVPGLHLDELGGNGADDNENGMEDEGGLAFTVPDQGRDMVEIYLTVERRDQNGKKVGDKRTKRVTCRN